MTDKLDRRVRKTRAQLRAGLARLMKKKSIKEITVKELVEEIDINRSTFYLHYTDINQMLESIEGELMEEITEALHAIPMDASSRGDTHPYITQIFSILNEHRDICSALLSPNGDIAFMGRIEALISQAFLRPLHTELPQTGENLEYAYAFSRHGCVGMIKTWLTQDNPATPSHMAQLAQTFVKNTLRDYLNL